MEHLNVERIYEDNEIVAYTTTRKPLTRSQYIKNINIGIEQCKNGDVLTLDELQKEIDTW
jgi:hypothetical protein